MSKLSKTITEKEKRNILAWTDVLGITMTSCTCYQPRLIGEAGLLAQTLALVHHPGRNSYIRPCVLIKVKEISSLWVEGWVTVSQSIHTLRPVQVLTGHSAYVTAGVSRRLSPSQNWADLVISLSRGRHLYQGAGMCASNVCMNGRAGRSRNKKGKLISE